MKTIENLLRPNIRNLNPYKAAREAFSAKADVFLDANENPFDWNYSRYPDSKQIKLRTKIAKWRKIAIEEVMLGNGSDEIIDLLIRIFCQPGKDMIRILDPSYGMYQVTASINDIRTIKTPLTKTFELELTDISYNPSEKIFFLCSPNNPTGNLIPLDLVIKILEEYPGIVVIDEAYIDFATIDSTVHLIKKYNNLVIIQTMSKSLALAGLRVGICISNRYIVNILLNVKAPYNISVLAQNKALSRLDQLPKLQEEILLIRVEKEYLKTELQQIESIEYVFPSEANFLLARAKNAKKLYEFLCSKGIVIRNRSNQRNCENCIRISIGTPQENKYLIQNIKSFNNVQ